MRKKTMQVNGGLTQLNMAICRICIHKTEALLLSVIKHNYQTTLSLGLLP